MNIYLAARFSRRSECYMLGSLLEKIGHTIVSRWSSPTSDHQTPVGKSKQAADQERKQFAIEDIEDIDASDWFICFMDEARNDGRGGKHVEFGYALAKEKRISIIGPRETVFHHLENVEWFSDITSFLLYLKRTYSHKGDPCIFCGVEHDNVESGYCSGAWK